MSRRMKDSGIEWIGEIPEDWEVVKTKNVFNYCREIVGDKVDDYDRLSLTLNGVLKRSKEDANGLQPTKFEGYQILRENDLVFKLIDLENVSTSRVGLSPYTGLVSPAYIKLSNEDASKFGYYYFLSMWHREIFNKLGGDGVRSNLGPKDLLNIPYVLVSEKQQQDIANFLDKKVAEIDHILNKTRESIEEYKKYKQSIITEAVTKGLNPDVKMKDSGIEWIGEIPEHWAKTRLKQTATIARGGSPRPIEAYITDDGSGVNWISINDTIKGSKFITNAKRKILEAGISKSRFVKKGTLLLTNSMSFGEPYILDLEGCIHDGWVAFSEYKNLDKEFLYYYFVSSLAKLQFDKIVAGGVVQNLNIDKIGDTLILLPPMEEQIAVVTYLDISCQKIDLLISKKEQLLTDLGAYKKSLIYECVTGKREVI